MCRLTNGNLRPSSLSAFRLVGLQELDPAPTSVPYSGSTSHGSSSVSMTRDVEVVPPTAPRVVDVDEQAERAAKKRKIASQYDSVEAEKVPLPSKVHRGAANNDCQLDFDDTNHSPVDATSSDATFHDMTSPGCVSNDSSDCFNSVASAIVRVRYALTTFKTDGTDRRHSYATGSKVEAPLGFENVSRMESGEWIIIDKIGSSKRDHELFIDEIGILRRYYTGTVRTLSAAFRAGIPVFWPSSSLRHCVRKLRLMDASLSRSARVSSSNLKRTAMNKCRSLVSKGAAPWSLFSTCTPTGTVHVQYCGSCPLSYRRFSELRSLLARLNEEHDHMDFLREHVDLDIPNLDELRVYARHVKNSISPEKQQMFFPATVASMTTSMLHESIASVRQHLRQVQ